MKEIGSEFWKAETTFHTQAYFPADNKNYFYTLSGRTALDLILKNIKQHKNVKKAYIPSFCCESMLTPFQLNGIGIEIYDVIITENGLKPLYNPEQNCDIVLMTEYFGYKTSEYELYKKAFKDKSYIIIEDITHSLFDKISNFSDLNDYTFASLRKYTGITDGGLIITNNSDLKNLISNETNNAFMQARLSAQHKKELYISGRTTDKESFLKLFAEAEDILHKDYLYYSMSQLAIEKFNRLDVNFITHMRKKNAKKLAEGLTGLKSVKPLYPVTDNQSVPFCFPVLVSNNKRDSLRKYLINKKIYLPVHWPKPFDNSMLTEATTRIYNEELSIVCDQRYTTGDMERIISEIRYFDNEGSE